jgi:hypothetical protein
VAISDDYCLEFSGCWVSDHLLPNHCLVFPLAMLRKKPVALPAHGQQVSREASNHSRYLFLIQTSLMIQTRKLRYVFEYLFMLWMTYAYIGNM